MTRNHKEIVKNNKEAKEINKKHFLTDASCNNWLKMHGCPMFRWNNIEKVADLYHDGFFASKTEERYEWLRKDKDE